MTEDQKILDKLQAMKLSFKEPGLIQIATWSERMKRDINLWLDGKGPKPDFLRAYERK